VRGEAGDERNGNGRTGMGDDGRLEEEGDGGALGFGAWLCTPIGGRN
jgi:hypothetical protein